VNEEMRRGIKKGKGRRGGFLIFSSVTLSLFFFSLSFVFAAGHNISFACASGLCGAATPHSEYEMM
jgi:hypothetical protein